MNDSVSRRIRLDLVTPAEAVLESLGHFGILCFFSILLVHDFVAPSGESSLIVNVFWSLACLYFLYTLRFGGTRSAIADSEARDTRDSFLPVPVRCLNRLLFVVAVGGMIRVASGGFSAYPDPLALAFYCLVVLGMICGMVLAERLDAACFLDLGTGYVEYRWEFYSLRGGRTLCHFKDVASVEILPEIRDWTAQGEPIPGYPVRLLLHDGRTIPVSDCLVDEEEAQETAQLARSVLRLPAK